jgi:hypothetical protein
VPGNKADAAPCEHLHLNHQQLDQFIVNKSKQKPESGVKYNTFGA